MLLPSRKELIAANATLAQIQQFLGVDKLLYQTQEDLVEAIRRRHGHQIENPCMACMDGRYVTGDITEDKMKELEQQR